MKAMFKKMQYVETAFQYIRLVSILVIAGSLLVNIYLIYRNYAFASRTANRIYVLANGKVLEAYAAERKDNLRVEAKDHIGMFHHYFFTLSPDDKAIEETITKALYLADVSAKNLYDNLKEGNYYSNIISGNVSQSIKADSITIHTDHYPYYFRYYGRQQLTRPTSIVERSVISEGYFRNISRSDNNPHGFLIERWAILENRDLSVKSRQP